MQQLTELEQQVWALQDIEAIRQLKARYLFSCDSKDPKTMRDCFADGKVHIDYGRVGVFDNADALVDLFTQLACHDHIVEMHHGVNPQIQIVDEDNAKARWGLHYQLINTRDKTLTQLGAYYDDKYRKTRDGWKIVETTCVVTSTLVLELGDAAMKTLFAGRAAPVSVDDPNKQAAR
jgi:hypothetical protein